MRNKLTRKQKLAKNLIFVGICLVILLFFLAYSDIALILFAVGAVATVVILLRSKPFALNTIVCITGAPGSGKTLTATQLAIRAYRKQRFLCFLNRITFGAVALFSPRAGYPPHLFSNIPICIAWRRGKPVFAEPLKLEHILLLEPLPEYSVCFVDEIGSFCGQWEFDNPYVQTNVQLFVRFYRHFIGTERAGLIMTEQSSDFIAKSIRDRVGMFVHMVETRRAWRILPVLRSRYVELLAVEGTSSSVVTNAKSLPYFAQLVPYRWMPQKRKVYESRCYKYLYRMKAIRDIKAFTDFYTRYLMDISCDESMRKNYMKHKRAYLDSFLYAAEEKAQPKAEPEPKAPA